MNDGPLLRRRFLVASAAVIAVFLYGAFAPLNPDFDTTVAIDTWRSLGKVGAATLALTFACLAIWGERASAMLASRRRESPFRWLMATGYVVALMHSDVSLSGDALDIVQRTARADVPLDHPLSGLLFLGVHRWAGVDAYQAVRVTSILCGVVYLVTAVAFTNRTYPGGPQRGTVLVLLLTAGCVALFCGSVETYAPPAAALLLFLTLALRRFREDDQGRGRTLAPAIAYGVFLALHGVAVFLAPAVLVLLNHERRRGAKVRSLVSWCAVALVPVVMTLLIVHFAGLRHDDKSMTSDAGRFLPLLKTAGNVGSRYAFLDGEHLIAVLATLFIAGPASWAVLLSRRVTVRGRPNLVFLAAATVPLLALPFVWNLAYTLRRDWDLFSLVGVPLALFATEGVIAAGVSRIDRLRVAFLALSAMVPFILTNAGTAAERRDHAVAARWTLAQGGATSDVLAVWDARIATLDTTRIVPRLEQAMTARDRGHVDTVEPLVRGILADEPQNVHALTLLGELLVARGEHDAREVEAEDVLRRAIQSRRENLRPRPRLALAKLMLSQGRNDEARAQLSRLVREDPQHPVVVEALTLLGGLLREIGDAESAAEIFALAEKRRGR